MQMKKIFCMLMMLGMLLFAIGAAAQESEVCLKHYEYKNGICMQCGKPCGHKRINEYVGEMNRREFVSVNGQFHSYTHDIGEFKACVYCRTEFIQETHKAGLYAEEMHSFEDGVCTECGYVNQCAHKNSYTLEEKDTRGRTDGEAIDEYFHRVGYDQRFQTYCQYCGELLESHEVKDAGMLVEGHVYGDECDACGYKKAACAHERVAESYYAYIDPDEGYKNVTYTDLRHTYEVEVYAIINCLDCGEHVDEVFDHKEVITQDHQYEVDSNGDCQFCGYNFNECKHPYTKVVERFETNWHNVLFADAQNHKVYGDRVRIEVCLTCEARVGDRKILQANCYELVPHSITEIGKCLDCGYRVECRHPARTVQDWYWMERNAAPVSDTQHVIYVDHIENNVCADCGTSISDRLAEVGVARTEAHDYDKNGVCGICEYVRGSLKDLKGEVVGSADELADEQALVPTLVADNILNDVMLVYEKLNSEKENTVVYEVSLQDRWGKTVDLKGEALLILPYPAGMDKDNAAALDIAIVHYGDTLTETFSTEDGTVELLAQGLGVRVRSLSPFEITWQEKPEADLPQTGDESCLVFWVLALIMATGMIGYRRAKEN